jgi:hypothetical protein
VFEELLGTHGRAGATPFKKVSRVISEGGAERVTLRLLVRGLEQAALSERWRRNCSALDSSRTSSGHTRAEFDSERGRMIVPGQCNKATTVDCSRSLKEA